MIETAVALPGQRWTYHPAPPPALGGASKAGLAAARPAVGGTQLSYIGKTDEMTGAEHSAHGGEHSRHSYIRQ